jgi:hypothetical protein
MGKEFYRNTVQDRESRWSKMEKIIQQNLPFREVIQIEPESRKIRQLSVVNSFEIKKAEDEVIRVMRPQIIFYISGVNRMKKLKKKNNFWSQNCLIGYRKKKLK